MNNKKGDIVYESNALDYHIVSMKRSNRKKDGNRLKALKFEERYKGRNNIPVKCISDIENIEEFKPFSFPNGKPKYSIYSFSKLRVSKLQPRTQKVVHQIITRARQIGLTLAYKEINSNGRNLSKKLKTFEFSINSLLDELWKKSYVNFMGKK